MARLSKVMTLGILIGISGIVICLLPFCVDLEEDIGLGLLFKLRGIRQPPSDIVIVSIDKESCDVLNVPENPTKWSRSLHAKLIDTLAREGADVIAFDLFFEDKGDGDSSFVEAMDNAKNVLLAGFLTSEETTVYDIEGTPTGGLNIVHFNHPYAEFESSAAGIAPFPLPKIPVKLNHYWTFKAGAGDMPTLPVVALQIFTFDVYKEFYELMNRARPSRSLNLPADREAIRSSASLSTMLQNIRAIFKNDPQIASKMLAALQSSKSLSDDIQQKQKLRALIKLYQGNDKRYFNFYGPPSTIPTISYYYALPQVIVTSPHPNVKGKAVFIGLSGSLRPEHKKDTFYTVFSDPSGSDLSGVEIAATAFANMIEDKHVQPIDHRAHIAIIFFWGLVLGIICRQLPALVSSLAVILLGVAYLTVAEYQFKTSAIWYPVFVPLMVQLPMILVSAVICKYKDVRMERDHIRKALGIYLPNDLVDRLTRNIVDIKATGQIVYGICLYSDAKEYTSVSEKMPPDELSRFMNKYYEAIFEPINKHRGEQFGTKGDSMLAIWRSRQPEPAAMREAGLAAIEIVRAVHKFNRSSHVQLPIRIGLHSGYIYLGNVGALDHYEFQPLGDVVNTSARLEGLNKYLGTEILVSEDMISQMRSASDLTDVFLTREIGKFLFKGKSVPMVVHELIGGIEDSDEQRRRSCAVFAEALNAFKNRSWGSAIEKFNESVSITKGDGPSSFYLRECENNKINQPSASWEGVLHMDDK